MSSVVEPTTTASMPFSRLVRERTSSGHRSSENSGFMGALLSGSASIDDYIALASQHWAIYAALEETPPGLDDDPVVAPFLTPALHRLPALEADLAVVLGADWRGRLQFVPATIAYAARIREVAANWPAGYVAHHYTRYLGDLSGGLHIGRIVARQFGLETEGTRFYHFDAISDPIAFKDAYRARLDAIAWSPDEQSRVIDEVVDAYAANTRIFEQLGAPGTAN